jgi:hypothetical protein
MGPPGRRSWQLHCAYLQEEGNQELNKQQQPWADGPWRAIDHLRVGEERSSLAQTGA